MNRASTIAAAGTLLSVFLVYALKYDTRELENRVHALERQIERAAADISVLTAEQAHLLRPERVDRLARARLGLRPIEPGQFIAIDALPLRAGSQDEAGSARARNPGHVPVGAGTRP